MVPAAEDAVDPHEHHVAVVVAVDGGERQDADAAHKDGRLAEVLPGDPALDAVPHDQQPERGAAERPR